MKTKTIKIEVVNTTILNVTLPETMSGEEFLKDWQEGLWELEDGILSVAKYAAEMAVYSPSSNHDGVGYMITSPFVEPANYQLNPYQVVAIKQSEYTESEILKEGPWE